MLRVPQEPDPDRFPERCKGVVIPPSLDFSNALDIEPSIQNHKRACIVAALQLSDLETEPHKEYIQHVRTETIDLKVGATGNSLQLRVDIDTIQIAGVSHDGLLGVRHVTEVPLSPKAYLDGYARISYTDLVDKFTYLVELVEDRSPPGKDEKTESDGWAHVAFTADKLAPILSERHFLTFDFISKQNNLSVSRSCKHPKRPPTPAPTFWFNPFGPKRTYRAPLFYFVRTLPIPNEPNKCKVVQFQFSDIGGVVPVEEQVKAVVQFGIDNTPKVVQCLVNAAKEGVKLGERDDEAYLKDPLKPSWRQNPRVMLGLKE
jgi:hypothetical protein